MLGQLFPYFFPQLFGVDFMTIDLAMSHKHEMNVCEKVNFLEQKQEIIPCFYKKQLRRPIIAMVTVLISQFRASSGFQYSLFSRAKGVESRV